MGDKPLFWRHSGSTKKWKWGPERPGPERQEPSRHTSLFNGSYGNHKRIRQAIKRTNKFRSDPFGQVINLSKINFTRAEYKLLGYNLNFIPTPNSINKTDLSRDIKQFDRRMKLRDHFGDTPRKNLSSNRIRPGYLRIPTTLYRPSWRTFQGR